MLRVLEAGSSVRAEGQLADHDVTSTGGTSDWGDGENGQEQGHGAAEDADHGSRHLSPGVTGFHSLRHAGILTRESGAGAVMPVRQKER